ncbi:MAG: hypothetical protein JOZ47_18110 [Kutzneria sp.]|nr:hypothetical protein [Kutzneria sp.]
MSAPSSEQVSVALEALRSDAGIWDKAADDLHTVTSAISGLTLRPEALSVWAVEQGVDRTYGDARGKLEEILGQAADDFGQIAKALRTAADIYEREDEQNMHKLKGVY